MKLRVSRNRCSIEIICLAAVLFGVLFPFISKSSVDEEMRKKWGLFEVLKFALENSNEIKILHHKKEVSKLGLQQSKSRFMPTLDFSMSQGLEMQKTPGSDNYKSSSPLAPWVSQLSLTGQQNIYNNGEDQINFNINEVKDLGMSMEEERVREDLIFKIIQNYFQYSLLVKNLEVKRMMNGLLKKQFRMVTNQYKAGHKTKIDYLRFKSKVEQGSLEIASFESEIKNLETSLKKEMGIDLKEKIMFRPVGDREFGLSKNFYDFKFDDLNLGKLALSQIKIAEMKGDLIRKKRWPKINLETNLNYGVPDYLSSKQSFNQNYGINFNVMLKISYSLFDGGKTTSEILAQKHQESLGRIEYLEKKRSWEEKKINLNENLKKLEDNVKLQKELTHLEEISFNTVEKDYRMGKATFLDYVNALTNLSDSKLNFIKNNYELKKTLMEKFYQQGKLYEVLFKI